MCAFGPASADRRLRELPLLGLDPTAGALAASLMAGPEIFPHGTGPLEAARDAILAA